MYYKRHNLLHRLPPCHATQFPPGPSCHDASPGSVRDVQIGFNAKLKQHSPLPTQTGNKEVWLHTLH